MCKMIASHGLEPMHCPECESQQIVKNGKVTLQGGAVVQKYVCKACRKQFNDRTGTPMARLRTPSTIVTLAMNVRTLRNGGASDWTVLWQISLHDSPLGEPFGKPTQPMVAYRAQDSRAHGRRR
jgi:hypothetical protein